MMYAHSQVVSSGSGEPTRGRFPVTPRADGRRPHFSPDKFPFRCENLLGFSVQREVTTVLDEVVRRFMKDAPIALMA